MLSRMDIAEALEILREIIPSVSGQRQQGYGRPSVDPYDEPKRFGNYGGSLVQALAEMFDRNFSRGPDALPNPFRHPNGASYGQPIRPVPSYYQPDYDFFPTPRAGQAHTGFGGPPAGSPPARPVLPPPPLPRYPVGPPPGNVGEGAPRHYTDAERQGTPRSYDPTPSYHPPVEYYDQAPDPALGRVSPVVELMKLLQKSGPQ